MRAVIHAYPLETIWAVMLLVFFTWAPARAYSYPDHRFEKDIVWCVPEGHDCYSELES